MVNDCQHWRPICQGREVMTPCISPLWTKTGVLQKLLANGLHISPVTHTTWNLWGHCLTGSTYNWSNFLRGNLSGTSICSQLNMQVQWCMTVGIGDQSAISPVTHVTEDDTNLNACDYTMKQCWDDLYSWVTVKVTFTASGNFVWSPPNWQEMSQSNCHNTLWPQVIAYLKLEVNSSISKSHNLET